MSRWFRTYDDMVDDPKVQMLPSDTFKTWMNLLCIASRNNGILPPVASLAFSLRVSTHEMQGRLDELILAGLIDIRSDKKLEPHNWARRQWKSDDSADRVRKCRENKKKKARNDGVTVTVTPPETETDSESETDSKTKPDSKNIVLSNPRMPRDAEPGSLRADAREQGFDNFGKRCHPAGVTDAEAILGPKGPGLVHQAERLGVDVEAIFDKIRRFKPENPVAYFVTLAGDEIEPKTCGAVQRGIIVAALNGRHAAFTAVTLATMSAPEALQ